MNVLKGAKVLKTLDISILDEIKTLLEAKYYISNRAQGVVIMLPKTMDLKEVPLAKVHKASVVLKVEDDKILVYKDQVNDLKDF